MLLWWFFSDKFWYALLDMNNLFSFFSLWEFSEKFSCQIRAIPWKPVHEDPLYFGVQNPVASFDGLFFLYWKRWQADTPYTLSSSLSQLTVMDLKARRLLLYQVLNKHKPKRNPILTQRKICCDTNNEYVQTQMHGLILIRTFLVLQKTI